MVNLSPGHARPDQPDRRRVQLERIRHTAHRVALSAAPWPLRRGLAGLGAAAAGAGQESPGRELAGLRRDVRADQHLLDLWGDPPGPGT